jgi:hypothetical protein
MKRKGALKIHNLYDHNSGYVPTFMAITDWRRYEVNTVKTAFDKTRDTV